MAVSLEYINGFLAAMASLKSQLDGNVLFVYFMHRYPMNGQFPKQVIAHKIRESTQIFYEENPHWTSKFDNIEYNLDNEFELIEHSDWRQSLEHLLIDWISDNWLKPREGNNINKERLIPHFIDLLVAFFAEDDLAMFTMEGKTKSDLYYHWGGINYQDYIFNTDSDIFHLHFHVTD